MGYCIFANFHIDSIERLQRMKDSYDSFKSSDIEVNLHLRPSHILNKISNGMYLFQQPNPPKGGFSTQEIYFQKLIVMLSFSGLKIIFA
jgi:hypothetical protein